MDQKVILEYLEQHSIHKIKFAFADIDGVLRGKIIHKKKFLEGLKEGYGFCDVVFGWDSADACYDNVKVTGWHSGYPDKQAVIDLSTFGTIPWENNTPFFLADFSNPHGSNLTVCPRSLLKKIQEDAVNSGFYPSFSQEFEWFNFRETPQSLEEKEFKKLNHLTPGMFGYSILRPSLESDYYNDLFDLLLRFDVPLEGLHTETGPGVYEAAIIHDSILKAADKAVLLKTAVKEIANKHGIIATFMAKIDEKLPGCSGHIHQSLWNKEHTENLFFDTQAENKMSNLFKSYLAGQLYCLPHILPMLAPTVNSYKRLVEGAWAPTSITWGMDNRTTALRVLNGSKESTRLEQRVSGADTNPYLAMAASLASGLYGIKHQLSLDIPETKGNGYKNKNNGMLASNLMEATQLFKTSTVAKELFGDEFVEHFSATREWEWNQFSKHVSDWEMKRYMEII
jgi:glutamine synthetase